MIKTVLDRLEKQPVIVEEENPNTKEKEKITIGKFDVQLIVGAYSGSDQFLSFVPRLFKAMENGDFSFIAQQSLGLRKSNASSLMSVAMDCASGISLERSAQIKREEKVSLLANAINAPFPEICAAIEYAQLGEDFRKPVKSNVPALFISGTLDGRTPVSNAEIAIKGFKNSSHLIIDGAGHSDPLFLSSPKIKRDDDEVYGRRKIAAGN